MGRVGGNAFVTATLAGTGRDGFGEKVDFGAIFLFPNPAREPRLPPAGETVTVAQSVEPRIVIPVVAGSSPVGHPTFCIGNFSSGSRGRKAF